MPRNYRVGNVFVSESQRRVLDALEPGWLSVRRGALNAISIIVLIREGLIEEKDYLSIHDRVLRLTPKGLIIRNVLEGRSARKLDRVFKRKEKQNNAKEA